jgi:hypothetical protein
VIHAMALLAAQIDLARVYLAFSILRDSFNWQQSLLTHNLRTVNI